MSHFNPNLADVGNLRGVLMNALRTSAAMNQDRGYSTVTHILAIAHDVYEIRLVELENYVSGNATNAILAFQYIARALESIRNERWDTPPPPPSGCPYDLTRITILMCNIVAQDIPVDGLYRRHAEALKRMDRYYVLRRSLVRLNSDLDDLEVEPEDQAEQDDDEDAMEELRPFISPVYDAVEQMRLHLTRKMGFVGVEVQGAAF